MTGTMGRYLLLSIRTVYIDRRQGNMQASFGQTVVAQLFTAGQPTWTKYLRGLAGVASRRGHDRALADQQFSAGFHRMLDVSFANKRFWLSWLCGAGRVLGLCSFVRSAGFAGARPRVARKRSIRFVSDSEEIGIRGRLLADFWKPTAAVPSLRSGAVGTSGPWHRGTWPVAARTRPV